MVNKITSPITPLEEVAKINEIIDGKQDTITSSNKLSASLVSGLATVATSGSYNDLSNQPTIPTVNNATLTITQGGTTKGTFTANASSDVTIALDAGGGGGSSRNMGEIIASTIPLSDAGLHLLDGSLISGSGSYSAFVTYIAGLYNQTVPTSVTYYAWYHTNWNSTVYTLSTTPSVGDHYFNYYNGEMIDPYIEGSAYPYYVTSVNSNSIGIDGEDAQRYTRDSSRDVTLTVQTPPTYFCSESDWQTSITNYGVCGKFVYDSVNNTVRLPKITGFTEGTTDVTALGDLIQAGLPNITGEFTLFATYGAGSSNGALNATFAGGTKSPNNLAGTGDMTVNFNASSSSSIYGNSTTVQPQAIKVLYYIVIANSVKTNIEVDIDEIATDLNGKADVDLTNVNASGTSVASGWSMPSSRYDDLTLGASDTTYTAPANGWFFIHKTGNSSGQYLAVINGTNSGNFSEYQSIGYDFFGGAQLTCLLPVKKGDKVLIGYSLGGTTNTFRFIYAEGESNV